MLEKTCLDLIPTGLYIENLRAVIDLVTFPGYVEINEFWHNFLNGYSSYNRWGKLSICEEFVAMNTGLVSTPEFCENFPSVMWSSMRFASGRPFVHRRPAWMFGLWLTDNPYGRTRDEQFLLSHQMLLQKPSHQTGDPKMVLRSRTKVIMLYYSPLTIAMRWKKL